MSAGLVLQAVVSGAAAGIVYGLLGLGFSLVRRSGRVLNFAHGDIAAAAAFVALAVAGGAVAAGGRVLAGGAAAVLAGALLAAGVRRIGVAPFAGDDAPLRVIAAVVALGLLLRAVVGLAFPLDTYAIPDLLPRLPLGHDGLLALPGGGLLRTRTVALLGAGVAAAVAYDLWLFRSRSGRAVRASADEPEAARLCGVAPGRQQLLAWTIAGGLAALAALLFAPERPFSLELGVVLGLKGIAAAVVGGLSSGRATLLGGLALGVGEAILTTLWLPALQVGNLQLLQLGPLPGIQDLAVLLALVGLLAAFPGRLGAADVVD